MPSQYRCAWPTRFRMTPPRQLTRDSRVVAHYTVYRPWFYAATTEPRRPRACPVYYVPHVRRKEADHVAPCNPSASVEPGPRRALAFPPARPGPGSHAVNRVLTLHGALEVR